MEISWQVDASPELLLAPLLSAFCLLCLHLSSCQRPCPVDLVRDTPLALPGAHVAPICQEDDESVPLEPSCPIMRAGESCAVCSGTWWAVVAIFVLVVSTAAISVPDRGSFYHEGSQRQRVGKYVLHEWDTYRTTYMEYYDRYIFEHNVFLTASGWICFCCYSWSKVSLCPTHLFNVPERPELSSYRETLSRVENHLKMFVRRGAISAAGHVSNRSDLLKINKQLYELE